MFGLTGEIGITRGKKKGVKGDKENTCSIQRKKCSVKMRRRNREKNDEIEKKMMEYRRVNRRITYM